MRARCTSAWIVSSCEASYFARDHTRVRVRVSAPGYLLGLARAEVLSLLCFIYVDGWNESPAARS